MENIWELFFSRCVCVYSNIYRNWYLAYERASEREIGNKKAHAAAGVLEYFEL